MSQKNRQRKLDWPEKLLVPVLVGFSFVGGMALNAWTIAEKIATKPYVDDRFTEAKRYIDEKSVFVLKSAMEHSDANRQSMLLELTKYSGALSAIEVKIDLMQKSIDSIIKEAFEIRYKRK